MWAGPTFTIDLCFGKRQVVRTLVDILRLRAEHQPETTAYTFLVDGEDKEISLSYCQLDQWARSIAELLVGNGLRGQQALLLYPPGLDFIAGFFACLYAGIIAVPAHPPDTARSRRTWGRLESIAADSEAGVVLTTESVLSTLENAMLQSPLLGSMKWLSSDTRRTETFHGALKLEPSADDIAFLQYTSGSTGKPRGVILTHTNLLHNASVVREFCCHDSSDSYVSWLPAFHDMGFMSGVLQPLYSGIPVVLLSPAAFLQRPFRWLKAISRYRATTSGGPNFAFDLCNRKTSPEERAELDLSSWAVAFNGAEPVRKETLERFALTFSPCGFRKEALYPCYGLAESTLLVTGGRRGEGPIIRSFDAEALGKGHVAPASQGPARFLVGCGRASEDGRIVIVDPETASRCSSWQVGEIWISGPSVGRGYWKKPEDTDQAFHGRIADEMEGHYLRTGDLGFVQDQQLFVTGRLKDLIIIRGINYYPQDIERTAENSDPSLRPGCGAAFSVESQGEERLVVVQEVDNRLHVDPVRITSAIRQSVSESHELRVYAAVLVKPGTIPKTSSGKIRRCACRKDFMDGTLDEVYRSIVDDSYRPPQKESFISKSLRAIQPDMRLPIAESYILQEVARILGQSPDLLVPEQPLSAAGLDSLTAMELKNHIETHLGVVVPTSKLLAGISSRKIALLVVNGLEAPVPELGKIKISGEEQSSHFDLSQTQKALWFFYKLAPEDAAYNVAFAVRIGSHANISALETAFQKVVDRHPAFRTRFAERNGRPIQEIEQGVQCQISQVPAAGLSERELRRAITDEAYKPFDLEHGPVYRASLFVWLPQEYVLLLAVHHIVIDGWSLLLVIEEIINLYETEIAGAELQLPPQAFKYSDYVRWQSEMLEGDEGARLFKYWSQQLSGHLPLLDLPTSRPHPPVQTYSGASYEFKLGDALVSRIRIIATSRGATVYMLLLAVFQILLHRYTGQDDILLGSPVSARSRAEFEGIVGCFFNAVVLRADFSSDVTFDEFLHRVRATVLDALDHQDYPSNLLSERLQPVRDPARPPLFQAQFVLHTLPKRSRVAIAFQNRQRPAEHNGLALSYFPLDRKHARIELELEMIEINETIHAWIHYNRDLFDRDMISRMARHFQVLAEGAVRSPIKRLSALPLLTEAEVEEALADKTADLGPFDYSGLEDCFLERATTRPDRIATIVNDEAISFHELNQRSTQLADLIRQLSRDQARP
jgi:acyl-CoA synthetase (AMP-forming)/AMP-acid ligase II/aryl carrier-like protein